MWGNIGGVALLIYGYIVGYIISSGSPRGREVANRYLLISLFGFIGIQFITIVIIGDLPSASITAACGEAAKYIFV